MTTEVAVVEPMVNAVFDASMFEPIMEQVSIDKLLVAVPTHVDEGTGCQLANVPLLVNTCPDEPALLFT